MILFEEEKSKLLLSGMPYLRPLYIKGVLSMHEILSISWKESIIDLKKKYENLKSNDKIANKSNTDNEIKELNNKLFLIYSFMQYFYQMINKGKLKKYDGFDYLYSKLNNFFTFCRKIISYKILDINLEEFNQTKIILKLIIHVKLFLIFCEYDTFESKEEFINYLLLTLSPDNLLKNFSKNNNVEKNKIDNENQINEEENMNNYINKHKEELVIENLIKEIELEKINLINIYNYTEKIYNSLNEKYKNFIKNDKFTFLKILYENYFELNSNEEEKENSDDGENNKNNNNDKCINKKKKKKRRNKKKNKNKEIKDKDNYNSIIQDNEEKNEIKIENKIEEKEIFKEKKEEDEKEKNNKMARINEKITMIKTIQTIAKLTNKLINNMTFNENFEKESNFISSLSQNKNNFEETKKKFLEPLTPYIKDYQKIHGNKKMSILSLLQCAYIVYQDKYKKEKQNLLKEIDNLKKTMNQMLIQIQLMGGGKDIFRRTLYYLILIFIPEEQNGSSFFTKVQNLITFFNSKINDDISLIKNLTSNNDKSPNENMTLIINRLHKNSQNVLFIKSIFFMYKFFNHISFLNKNGKLNNRNELMKNEINEHENNPNIKDYFLEENYMNENNNINEEKSFPSLNFCDCYSSYANFLDEIVTNEKTQIILEQVINNIKKENAKIEGPKFEINDLFQEKEGKKLFNLTGFEVQIIIHDLKKLEYKGETLENLVNSKTLEKSKKD